MWDNSTVEASGFINGTIICGVGIWADYQVGIPNNCLINKLGALSLLIDGNDISITGSSILILLNAFLTMTLVGPTAYFGLIDITDPQFGETIVISSNASGWIGKFKGCCVVAIACTNEKYFWIKNELGFDDIINYRTIADSNIVKASKAKCLNSIGIYFDNVGGEILNACLELMNQKSYISVCGFISYVNNAAEPILGPYNYYMHGLDASVKD